jgi:hypothetical protein
VRREDEQLSRLGFDRELGRGEQTAGLVTDDAALGKVGRVPAKLLECPQRMGPATDTSSRNRIICPRRSPLSARSFATDLIDHCCPFSLLATSKGMTGGTW